MSVYMKSGSTATFYVESETNYSIHPFLTAESLSYRSDERSEGLSSATGRSYLLVWSDRYLPVALKTEVAGPT
jgi:hypothetical protein